MRPNLTRRSFGLLVVVAVAIGACGVALEPAPPPTTTGDAGTSDPHPVLVDRVEPPDDAPILELTTGFNQAGFAWWSGRPVEDNLVFSPLSIGHALLMVHPAGDEPTQAAIAAAFGLGNQAHEAWNALDRSLAEAADSQPDITVSIADRVWPKVGRSIDTEWLELLGRHHGASVEPLDFDGDPDGSRDVINGWVSDQTQALIPELLPEGFIQPGQTVLILTDAVFFEAKWQTVFGKYDPVDGTFTRLDGSTVDVEFMQELELSDRRGTGDGFVGAEIPYAGGEYSMLLLVPDEGLFEEVRSQLSSELISDLDAAWTPGPFELLLPKWETTTALDLVPWLTELGAAPGSYPAIGPDVTLEAAVHGADIAVNEEGTVAAAATALGFAESGPPEPELTVAADRPFLYLIRHRPTGAVLFAGQVTDPTA